MQCAQCNAEIEDERWVKCPSCGSKLAPSLAMRFNPDALAGATGQSASSGSASKGGGWPAAVWIALLIVAALVVVFFLVHR
jgi:hypothetical protein